MDCLCCDSSCWLFCQPSMEYVSARTREHARACARACITQSTQTPSARPISHVAISRGKTAKYVATWSASAGLIFWALPSGTQVSVISAEDSGQVFLSACVLLVASSASASSPHVSKVAKGLLLYTYRTGGRRAPAHKLRKDATGTDTHATAMNTWQVFHMEWFENDDQGQEDVLFCSTIDGRSRAWLPTCP